MNQVSFSFNTNTKIEISAKSNSQTKANIEQRQEFSGNLPPLATIKGSQTTEVKTDQKVNYKSSKHFEYSGGRLEKWSGSQNTKKKKELQPEAKSGSSYRKRGNGLLNRLHRNPFDLINSSSDSKAEVKKSKVVKDEVVKTSSPPPEVEVVRIETVIREPDQVSPQGELQKLIYLRPGRRFLFNFNQLSLGLIN